MAKTTKRAAEYKAMAAAAVATSKTLRNEDFGTDSAAGELLGFMQTAGLAALLAAANGRIDLNAIAKRELASRGLSAMTGEWVGFAAAEAERVSGPSRHVVNGRTVIVPGRE